MQNVLGEEVYGSYFEILSLVFLFNIINDFGINVYNTRIVSQEVNLVQEQFKKLIGLKLILGLIFLGVLSISFVLLGYSYDVYYILLLVAGVFILTSYFMFMRSNLAGLGLYKSDSVISVVDRVVLIILMFYFLYYRDTGLFKIENFLYSQIISLLIAIGIARVLLWKHIKGMSIQVSQYFSRDFLYKSMPYAVVVILMTVYSRMDGVMLGRMLDDNSGEAGIYAAGYRLFEAGSMFAYLFAALLLPMYSRLMKTRGELQSLSEMAYKLIWIYVIVVALAFVFYNQEISELLYIEGDEYYGSVLMILMISLIGIAVSYIYGTMIVAEGSMYKLNWIFLFCIVLNFVLNYILIPSHKAYGAAIATLVTQFVAMIGQIVVCHQVVGLKYNFKMYGYSIIYGIIIGVIFYFNTGFFGEWWISLGVNIILSMIIAFLMRMIDYSFLLKMIRSKVVE